MTMLRTSVGLALVGLTLALGGCAHVHPWERETLAAPGMQAPPCAPVARESEHVIAVREASRGGTGSVGGGCGCN